jgi:hypothetical protein
MIPQISREGKDIGALCGGLTGVLFDSSILSVVEVIANFDPSARANEKLHAYSPIPCGAIRNHTVKSLSLRSSPWQIATVHPDMATPEHLSRWGQL